VLTVRCATFALIEQNAIGAAGFERLERDGESRDDFWIKKAGLEALRVTEALGQPPPEKLIRRLQDLLPPLRASLEKRLERLKTQADKEMTGEKN